MNTEFAIVREDRNIYSPWSARPSSISRQPRNALCLPPLSLSRF